MYLPFNYGKVFNERFQAVYVQVALNRLLKFAELSQTQGKIKRKSGRLHGWGRYGSMDGTDRAESGTEAESDAGC